MSTREIARQTGYDRNTTRESLRSAELPTFEPRVRPFKPEPIKEHVQAEMAEGSVKRIDSWLNSGPTSASAATQFSMASRNPSVS